MSHKIENLLRGIAGTFIMLAVLLYFVHSPLWIWFIGFIGLNLFQSAFTGTCPMVWILKNVFKVK